MTISGRFFERKEIGAGTMGTKRSHYDDLHYYVNESPEGEIILGMVNGKGESSGIEVERISKDDFAKRFKPCSEHDCQFVEKTDEELEKKKLRNIEDMAEEHLKNKEFISAEYEYGTVLKEDKESIRANYGIGKVYLETGRKEDAKKVFSKLSEIDALYEEENKHTFNRLGIDLRKQGMFDEAIANYKKAISIDPKDNVLYYNLGRAYKEKGDIETALEMVKKALRIKPDFAEARDYLPYLASKRG